MSCASCFFFQAEDGIRDYKVTGVQTCALPIYRVMVLSYDQLTADAETTLQRLEAFTGVTRIDRGVLAHRVNEWSRDDERRSEERRVGKEWRTGWSTWPEKRRKNNERKEVMKRR